MRPIKMRLTAFGPFPDTQTVDFRPALGARLFGIYGPTGAGKTSILDGICFALFGESSGQERQGDDLRSHHATPDIETEVSLIFEVGAKRYNVVRRPRQTVRGKRGDALVERQHWAALYDATDIEVDDIDADNPGVVMEERKVEVVADRMRSILNYSAAQFRQVVLLPQGQFRQLLTASSDQRSTVLRGLFDVSLYERFVEGLKAEASELRDEVETGRSAINGHLQAHAVSDTDALAALIETLTADVGVQTTGRDDARGVRDAARETLQAAQQIQDRFAEHDAAVDGLNGVLARAPGIDILNQRKAAAERAVACVAADDRANEAENDLIAGLAARTLAADQASEAARLLSEAMAVLHASAARQPERDAAVAAVTQLEGVRRRVAGAEPLREAERSASQAAVEAKAALEWAVSDHGVAEQANAAANAQLASVQQTVLRITQVEGALQLLRQAQEKAAQFANANAAVETFAAARSAALAKHEQLSAVLAAYRGAESAAEEALASAQATHLAAKLEDGTPCPVCGATEHPRPASGGGEGLGLDAAWRQARNAREAADADERQAAQVAARADGEWTQAVSTLAALKAPERDVAAITADIVAAKDELEALQAGPDVATVQAAVDAAKLRLASETATLAAARDQHVAADKTVTSAAAALTASLADVPEDLRDAASVALHVQAAIDHRDQLNEAHQVAVENERRASEAAQAARSWLGHAEARVTELTAARDTHRDAFVAAKMTAGLTDLAYTAAKADIPNIQGLAATITEHVAGLAAAQDRKDRAVAAIADLDRPNMVASSAALTDADSNLTKAEELLTTTTMRLSQLEATQALVARLAAELAEATERYRVLGELALLTDGRNAHRLRLRDFAIAATFDLVLEAANQRFSRMSRGRFSLLRKYEGGDGRARAGLDIEVYDAHTDQKRDAHTLSGGEGFLASLSLALGLSDVVQAEAGGVKLDAIFIDEGFGHLDDETLDVALDTLRDLVGQDRAVGVISHVEAVKEQIPMGFDVFRQPQGSVISQRVGI
ncbi:AAA family ATPase [Caulobacter sp. NIBR2454]|uniref:AAA family ATPase n=1 Tax=Caulobacter sp. NIBR2454 TaxID=3015996 RepID=UPI0022B6B3B9|nr:SMC family ATPase [Caulobacter sp. NIBR2454]